ncbi:hypothetical protein [Bacillus massiliglaciei]|uniref:hypothetical protein n=1 Tax=Bacillus massiliglaciei TaxID=1816693 RepID=UPI000DA5F547|nr:hypothetical protein [Bacillus massiliglaciei]
MKIKLLKDIHKQGRGRIANKGELFEVRQLYSLTLLDRRWKYQVIDGALSGELFDPDVCLEIKEDDEQPAEDVFTEQEVEDIKLHYIEQLDKEKEKNDRLILAVTNLIRLMAERNGHELKIDELLTLMKESPLFQINTIQR